MKKTTLLSTLTALLLAAASLGAQDNTTDGYLWPEDPAVLEKLDAWRDLKFGVLIHWGLYSVPGIVESWNLCNEEWIVRPEGSVYEEYKKWYWGLSKAFNPVDFDPSQWAEVFAGAGMKYMIFTTKHHDGFCLFDSENTDFSLAKAGPFAADPRRDAAKLVFNAFREKGFMIGAYFSKPDWHHPGFWNPYYATPNRRINYNKEKHPDWWQSYVDYTMAQLKEITGGRYGQLDILWLDGGWITGDEVGLNELLPGMRAVSPGMLCVDRVIGGPNENYQTPEQAVPERQLDHPWESCISLTDDWGWTPNARYKSARRILGTLAEISAKGGSLALGVGPTARGLINPEAIDVLEEIGSWMRRCGEAVYGTRNTPVYNDGRLWFSQSKDGKTVYAVYALPEGETLPAELRWSAGNIPAGKVTVLNNGRKVRAKTAPDGTVSLRLPSGLAEEPVALKFTVE